MNYKHYKLETVKDLIRLVKAGGTPEQKFRLALSTVYAMSEDDIGSITANNIDHMAHVIRFHTPMARRTRIHRIPAEVRPFLYGYLDQAEPRSEAEMDALFANMCKQVGFSQSEGEGWKDIMRCVITGLYDNGVDRDVIARWEGWRPTLSDPDDEIFGNHPFLQVWGEDESVEDKYTGVVEAEASTEVRKREMTTKECPHCGQLLGSAAFKCTRCKKYVDNEVFNKLCDSDVKLIENNDLDIMNPTSMANLIIDRLKKGDYLKSFAEKKTLNEEEQFNLLVFNSFCHFMATCRFAKMKEGCSQNITETLKVALLKCVAELYNATLEHAPSFPPTTEIPFEHDYETLVERGKVLFAKLQAILGEVHWEASGSSQLIASDAFASAVFGKDSPLLSSGLILWIYFMEMYTPKVLPNIFSRAFLVEEQDLD